MDEQFFGSDDRTFGSELRRLRTLADLSQRAAAALVDHVAASVSNWENDRSLPGLDVARTLDTALGGHGGLVTLWEAAKRADGVPAHLRDDVALLSQSRAVDVVHPGGVPGLVQHPAYAHHVLTAGRPTDPPSAVTARVDARCRVLDGPGRDVRVTAVFPAAALDAVPPPVAQAQAAHLVDLVDAGRLTVHLVQSPGLPGVTAPFSLYRFRDGGTAGTSDHAVGSVVLGPGDLVFLADVARSALADADPSSSSALYLKEKAK